jgi:hypothetical protein
MDLFILQLFLKIFDLVNHIEKSIFKGSSLNIFIRAFLNGTVPENESPANGAAVLPSDVRGGVLPCDRKGRRLP